MEAIYNILRSSDEANNDKAEHSETTGKARTREVS